MNYLPITYQHTYPYLLLLSLLPITCSMVYKSMVDNVQGSGPSITESFQKIRVLLG